MIVVIVLSCFAIMASPQPVSTDAPPPLSEQGDLQTQTFQTTEATTHKPEAQVLGTYPLNNEQPQPGIPNIPAPHGGSHFLPFLQYYPWSPVGGSPLMIPMQMNGQGSQPSNPATPQQPLIFPPYGYFPLLSPPYRNQQVSPYGFPMTFDAPLPQIPANNPPISPQTPSGSGHAVKSPQPSHQTQNPQVFYMLQQPVVSAKEEDFISADKRSNDSKILLFGNYQSQRSQY
ncbi:E3 ubiquitin-protein ligase Hakai-like [Thalassophryne amazonica]|uniref:E3 ubiquitin-protein ligase Hakai-like n=1 Tax=Thalassophryne amazonica TaxID=390379 RepID=UPI001471E344|nr:E3 ubiquitin-protein ligase Hakai-like [Thalassophryne amazonica]